jgi:acyl-CoA thioester hydrolase
MSALSFAYDYRVPYSQCTVGNHVYYSRYLEILETARNEFFRHLGLTFAELQAAEFIFPVIECRLRYLAPARYDDVLKIEIQVSLAERARLNFSYRVANQHEVRILEAETFHVCTNLEEKPQRLPDDLKHKLAPYLVSSSA